MAAELSPDQVLAAVRRACSGGKQPTMHQLADEAGVGVRTLFRTYGSRDDLLAAAGCEQPPSARQRILAAGLELVGRSGLPGLSMDELAVKSGVSRATLYRLFPGKDALFEGLVQTFSPWEPVADILAASADGHPDEVIPAIARAIADTLSGRAGMLLRIVVELSGGAPDTVAARHHALGRGLPDLVAYLERQMSAGRLRQMPALIACQLLAGPILAGHLTRPLAEAMDPRGPNAEEQLDQIVSAWQRAMAPETG
jgi:AcrR family transcriptional regulator